MDGLLISGLLVIPCISAGTLAISVGSKVILSGSLVVKSSFEQVHLWFSFVPVDWARFDHGPCVILTHLSLPPVPWWQYIRYVVILWLFASIAPYYAPDRAMSAPRVPVYTGIWQSYLWCSALFQPIMVELQWEVNTRDSHRLYGLAWSADRWCR